MGVKPECGKLRRKWLFSSLLLRMYTTVGTQVLMPYYRGARYRQQAGTTRVLAHPRALSLLVGCALYDGVRIPSTLGTAEVASTTGGAPTHHGGPGTARSPFLLAPRPSRRSRFWDKICDRGQQLRTPCPPCGVLVSSIQLAGTNPQLRGTAATTPC